MSFPISVAGYLYVRVFFWRNQRQSSSHENACACRATQVRVAFRTGVGQPAGEIGGCSPRHAFSSYVLPFIDGLGQVRLIAGRYFRHYAKATVDIEPAACISRAKGRSLTQELPHNDTHSHLHVYYPPVSAIKAYQLRMHAGLPRPRPWC